MIIVDEIDYLLADFRTIETLRDLHDETGVPIIYPKRQIHILSSEQLVQLFKITNKKYPYLIPIIQNMITLKQPLNTILTGCEQEKKSIKRKIRKDFYKIKQEMGLENYKLNDLRYCNKIDN